MLWTQHISEKPFITWYLFSHKHNTVCKLFNYFIAKSRERHVEKYALYLSQLQTHDIWHTIPASPDHQAHILLKYLYSNLPFFYMACIGSFHMLSLLANDYLAHCVELLEAEERTYEMMRNISLDCDATSVPAVPGKQTVLSATNTNQDIFGGYSWKSIYLIPKIDIALCFSSLIKFTWGITMSVFVNMMAVYYSVHSSLVLFNLSYHIPFYSYISIQEQECAYIFI